MRSESGETRSIWMSETVPEFAPLGGDARTDICVVGAGIAGLTTAYCLARSGRSVLVLEDGSIGGGESSRTTAHLSNALDDTYAILERVHGKDGARLAADSHSAAIDRIESIVHDERIDCGFVRLDGFLFRRDEDHPDTLERELEAARRAGLDAVMLIPGSPLAGFDTGPCLRFPRQAQFHPLEYLAGIAKALVAAGGKICTGTRVTAVEDGSPCRVMTRRGDSVLANAVVVATNAPISDRLRIHTKQAPYRTYAIALELPRDAVPLGLYWDTGDPYHYVRLQSDRRTALIVGGEDHKTGQAHDAHERFARLESWTRERFPASGPVRYRWSGQVMEPVDHLAFIGRNPGARHVYIATGDSGHGMTHGTIAGMLITDLIFGRENPWARLYAPDRKSARTLGTYARENLNVARQISHHLTSGDVPDIAAILPGTGAIIRQGARKLAVYREEDGTVHAHSAVCTHVGCLVSWNDLEKTWDCPCHGSRFDVHGEVISGPAHVPLASVPVDVESSRPPPTDRTVDDSSRRL